MAGQPPESALRLQVPGAIGGGRTAPASQLAEEVVRLFDQLRDRLLRYVISFGLPLQDGEDIVQETFLALFRHMQLGRSCKNLRAWTFQVAHNQALKRRGQARLAVQQATDERTPLADLVPDMSPNPEDELAINRRRQRV
jgi:RNA polymerase sigma-70 factor (ECF subfamily)